MHVSQDPDTAQWRVEPLRMELYRKSPTFVINTFDTLFNQHCWFLLWCFWTSAFWPYSSTGIWLKSCVTSIPALQTRQSVANIPKTAGRERPNKPWDTLQALWGRGWREGQDRGDTREREDICSVPHCAKFIGVEWQHMAVHRFHKHIYTIVWSRSSTSRNTHMHRFYKSLSYGQFWF